MSVDEQMNRVQSLPVDEGDEWVMERRTLSVHIEEEGDICPDFLICASLGKGFVIGANVVSSRTAESEVLSWALNCMLSPMMGEPHRPARIRLTGGKLGHLQEPLERLGVSVKATSRPSPELSAVVAALEHDLTTPGVPPYLSRSGVDAKAVADFFRAAADFYKLKPWELFGMEMPIKVQLQLKGGKVNYWAIVMGVGGQEFGLSIYRSFDDLMELMETEDDEEALEVSQRIWSLTFSSEDVDDIGPEAQQEYVSNNWVLADDSLYPSAIVMDPKAKEFVNRPTRKQLVDLTAVTRAVRAFLRANRKKVESEQVIMDLVNVRAGGEEIQVLVAMPAPELLDSLMSGE